MILLKVATGDVPHVSDAQRLEVVPARLGFVTITARYGYQDEPDVPAALELAQRQGLGIDLESVSYYVNHVSLVPDRGEAPMAAWRMRLFALLLPELDARPPATSTSRPTGWSRWACTWRCSRLPDRELLDAVAAGVGDVERGTPNLELGRIVELPLARAEAAELLQEHPDR